MQNTIVKNKRYLRWWLDDLPPMNGLLRFAFYMGLLILTQFHYKSPFRAFELYKTTDPALFRAYGLLELIGVPHISPVIIEGVIWITVIACVFAAIGFLTRTASAITAAGFLFLHGMFFGAAAFNHSWHFSLYALILLIFSRTRDRFSMDYFLFQKRSRRVFGQKSKSLADTGFARKALLVVAVGFYFSAGVSKLLDAGPSWMDGHTLQYSFLITNRWLAVEIANHLWLCSAISIVTLLIELGSPVALFSRRARIFFIVAWVFMHFAINVTMGLWFFVNCWCMILLIDWKTARLRLLAILKGAKIAIPTKQPFGMRPTLKRSTSQFLGVALGTLLFPLFLSVALFQLDWWPFTTVDMYSSYYGGGILAGHEKEAYWTVEKAQKIARRCRENGCTRHVKRYLAYRVSLRLSTIDKRPLYLHKGVGVSSAKQWITVIIPPIITQHLAQKPIGDIQYDAQQPDSPATTFLREIVPVIRRSVPNWRDYEWAQLIYRKKYGKVVIASVSLHQI